MWVLKNGVGSPGLFYPKGSDGSGSFYDFVILDKCDDVHSADETEHVKGSI